MIKIPVPRLKVVLFQWILFAALAHAQSAPATPVAAATATPVAHSVMRTTGLDPRARKYYQLVWGVDALTVKSVESGEMIRFSYTVLNASKAAPIHDKKINPALIDEQAHVSLVIPTLEKVGQLRQTGAPEDGRSYWMVFSNKGNVVKPGDRVSVWIGKFKVDGLTVQ